MTKIEFKAAAEKAGIDPNLYGAVLSAGIHCIDNYGPISGGKIIGIVWKNGWKTEPRYNYMRGYIEEKFVSSTPYVVLKKDRKMYHAEVAEVNAYLDRLFRSWLTERIRSGDPL